MDEILCYFLVYSWTQTQDSSPSLCTSFSKLLMTITFSDLDNSKIMDHTSFSFGRGRSHFKFRNRWSSEETASSDTGQCPRMRSMKGRPRRTRNFSCSSRADYLTPCNFLVSSWKMEKMGNAISLLLYWFISRAAQRPFHPPQCIQKKKKPPRNPTGSENGFSDSGTFHCRAPLSSRQICFIQNKTY